MDCCLLDVPHLQVHIWIAQAHFQPIRQHIVTAMILSIPPPIYRKTPYMNYTASKET